MFINRRMEYQLHGDPSRRYYGLYNKYLLPVFYNLVNFIYPINLQAELVCWPVAMGELCCMLMSVPCACLYVLLHLFILPIQCALFEPFFLTAPTPPSVTLWLFYSLNPNTII